MLSESQQYSVWEGWLSAEIRAAYFTELVQRLQTRQRLLLFCGLMLSSAATLTLLTGLVATRFAWVKPMLTLFAATASLWPLAARYERNLIECADLQTRWATLALGYEALWSDLESEDASLRLAGLRAEEVAVTRSSTSQPAHAGLLEKVHQSVLTHHENLLAM